MQHYFFLGILLYILWNSAAFILMMLDKQRARRKQWRIRERTFFLLALFFGAAGILMGMYVFRHKTRHWAFVIGMPVLCLANGICMYVLWR